MTQREILTINIGQCGINLGHALLEQYCVEHKIDRLGTTNIIKMVQPKPYILITSIKKIQTIITQFQIFSKKYQMEDSLQET